MIRSARDPICQVYFDEDVIDNENTLRKNIQNKNNPDKIVEEKK